ncbi:uncharacterized protein [Littorina saxatilis]|uniref:uncharacterized protein n=1 Tax=Littorina saxatilis TaxID=31220 RepID=UPI0038B4DFBD
MQTLRYFGVDSSQYQQESLALRRSSREAKMTEKGKAYQMKLLTDNFRSDRDNLQAFLAETDHELQKEEVDCEDVIARRMKVTSLLTSLKETAERLKELSDTSEEDIDSALAEMTDASVTTMNKIVTATKHMYSHSSTRSHASHSSRRSKASTTSTTSSRRVAAAAETAALRVKLEAQHIENEGQEELEQLEFEEKMRRLNAERKMANLKRKHEAQKVETQLKMEEARLYALEQTSSSTSSRSSCKSTSSRTMPGRTDNNPTKQNLRAHASVFTPETHDENLVEALARAITSSRLPIPEPPIFTGDSLQYPDWSFSFTSLIENKGVPPEERIHFLKRYLGGPAKEAVSGFFMLRSKDAYQRARDILEQRFGNSYVISEAFRSKLDAWPKVHNKDKSGLRNLSDFLLQCQAAAAEVEDMKFLDDMREIKKITAKLPDWMVHTWNRKIAKSKRDKGRYPNFQEFASFVSEESEILNDPILSSEPSPVQPPVKQQIRKHGDSYTSQRTVLSTGQNEIHEPKPSTSCLFCKRQNHSLNECRDFMNKQMAERKDYVRKEGLCFACLRQGHMSKECVKRSDCKKCKRKHPTSLHEERQYFGVEQPVRKEQNNREGNATCRKVLSKTKNSLTSMAVPVYLSTEQNPDHELLVYALLDTMSDSTFVLDSVAEDLQASSEPATLRLTTMTDSSVTISCQKYTNLKVRGFNSEKTISLPAMYSRDHIPLDYEHIPSPETASKWPHLSRLKDRLAPRQDCPVGILIGYNCPRALAPLNCVVGEGNQPYAVETELGWSIVGGTTANKERFDAIGHSHRVVTQEVPPSICRPEKSVTYVYKTQIKEVTATDLIKLMEQDFKDQSSDVRSMSQEDKTFPKTLKEGIHQRADGYYEMPLPSKNGEPKLPNNRQADHASRGFSVDEISTSNWLTGPEILWKREITAEDIDIEISPQDAEVKSTTVFTTHSVTSFEEKTGRFSSYKKAVAAVATIVKCCARKQNKQISALEANQIAKRNLIRVIQREAFGGVCELKSKSNPLRDLDPFLDDDSLLRVGGRLRKTSELYGVKHPLILPKNSHLSRLIAVHHHKKTAHQGRSLTMNDIRSSGYWIIGCRRVTSSLINQCVTCIKHRGKARGQRMADLPKERVEPSPPPPGGFEKEDLYLKKRWRRVQFLADLFWTRWRREYLQTLQTRNTWQKAQRNICVGDIVLLQDDGICRADWKVAKVVETFPSDDGLVRKVRLLMATSELNNHGQPLHKRTYLDRPAHKLVVLLARDTLTVD